MSTNDWTDFHEIKLAGQLFAKSPINNFLENPTNCLVDNTRSRGLTMDGSRLHIKLSIISFVKNA